MAVLTINNKTITKVTENPFPSVRFSINKNLTDSQKQSGLVAKVQLTHPSVKCLVDVWRRNGRVYATEPSQRSTNAEGKSRFFAHFLLNDTLKQYICHIAVNGDNSEPWYLSMQGAHSYTITGEPSNPDLGIDSIELVGNMTDNQVSKGMLCKANITLDIGTFYQYTVWNSIFDKSIYGNAPQSNYDPSRERNGAPAYRLTEEAIAQVLGYIHPMVQFDIDAQVSSATKAVKEVIEELEDMEFTSVGALAFGVDEDEE